MNELIPTPKDSLVVALTERRLTAAEFHGLAEVPAAAEWFANLYNPRTRRAYQGDLQDFCRFIGITNPEQFRALTRAHVRDQRPSRSQHHQDGCRHRE